MEILVPDEFKGLYVQDAKRPIVKYPARVLRETAREVDRVSKKTQQLIDDMMKLMKQANGVGLAAPQIGILQRVIVIAPEDMKPMAIINPRVVRAEGEQIGQEGCLSIPGLYGDVKRAKHVDVEGYDRKGRPITLELEDLPARVVQHEVDHLDGVLFIDKVDFATLHWMDPEEGRAE